MRAQELRQAVADCRARALYASAKWAAAALCGLPEEEVMGSQQQQQPDSSSGGGGGSAAYELARSLFDLKVRAAWLLLLAHGTVRCCLCNALRVAAPSSTTTAGPTLAICPPDVPRRVQEYRSVAHTLRDAHDPASTFLRCYATYLAGEKRKE